MLEGPNLLRQVIQILLVLVLTGCNFPGFRSNQNHPGQQLPASVNGDENLAPLAVVTFQAQVPQGTPPDQAIFIEILDEVTGLALNVRRHQMQYISTHLVSIALPLQVGSIIKYRYSRFGNYPVNEETTQGDPVRYRLFHVINPAIVKDIISGWTDLPYTGLTGRIIGQVKSSADGSPLVGLLASAGGIQSFTSTDGGFIIEGLPPGIHNLVIYAIDGSYSTFQQGALIAPEATTPATIELQPSEYANVEFVVHVPPNTLPGIPIRIAGNLYQFGNTFSDLNGGVNTVASRMPVLNPQPDGTYTIQLSLPIGTYIEYKYTFGDGFWNAEHKPNGEFNLRNLIITKEQTKIEDFIVSWGENPSAAPVLFDVRVPENTPQEEYVSIQFNPFGWMEPVPMWSLGENRWAYLLVSPLSAQQILSYRYCRNNLCGHADDSATPGNDSVGRVIHTSETRQIFQDQVDAWNYLDPQAETVHQGSNSIEVIRDSFISGIELTHIYHPAFKPRLNSSFSEIRQLGANAVVLTPTWTFMDTNPLTLMIQPSQDPFWLDIQEMVSIARESGLAVYLFPQPNFPGDSQSWWLNAPLDFAWWVNWFERYRDFVVYHADLAERAGAQGIILGGGWLEPAMPGGKLPDNTPANLPADIVQRWKEIISQVRNHFSGEIYWALLANPAGLNPPPFSEKIDRFYLIWSLPLIRSSESTFQDFTRVAGDYLDTKVFPIQITTGKSFLIGITYPSAEGALSGCVAELPSESSRNCLDFSLLSAPNPDYPSVTLDFEEQYEAYKAVLSASLHREWIEGITARGYYYPATLQDKSISPKGKPAIELLRHLFGSKDTD